MGAVAIAGKQGKARVLVDRRVITASLLGILAVFWFMFLSAWLGVKPGAVITSRQNVLFDSDMNLWVARMIGSGRSVEQTIHPLEILFWRYPCRALAHLAALFMPADYASLFGPRLLVALLAGAGVGFLVYLALYLGVRPLQGALLFGCYLLFTNNTTIALPEHFGISNGLLSIAFVVLVVVANERVRNSLLAALVVMCGGTSVPNGLFPALCFFQSFIKSSVLKVRLLLASIPIGLGMAVVLYRISRTIHQFFDLYATFRLIYRPLQALIYGVYMLVLPAVGGIPFLKNPWAFKDSPEWRMVSYDPMPKPLDFSPYFGIQAIGAILWLILLARCTQLSLQDSDTRPYARVALLWLLYNLVFYNVWGKESLLWAPAWSWALMALVILGARHLSRALTLITVLPIAICQIVTLNEIKSLLVTVAK